ncbi:MAG: hypothetical protein ACTSQA_00510 [Candidatus Heimdallarchaeaceae archaeon]
MERLAKAIKLAAKLRKESFNHTLAEKAAKTSKDILGVNFDCLYSLTLREACNKAAKEYGIEEVTPMYLLLRNTWEEILAWIERVERSKQ